MIDFIKLSLPRHYISVLKDQLDFTRPVNCKTGELGANKQSGAHRNMQIEILGDTYCCISGSLHKYCKNGKNYGDFTYSDLVETIITICQRLQINPFEARLHNLEFGVNINTPKSPDELLNNLINYKGTPFNRMRSWKDQSIGYDCYKRQYGIKVYNKGKQYQREENILRYELKVIKMEKIENVGIHYLADLCDRRKLAILGGMLITSFEQIILYDPSFKTAKLNKEKRKFFRDASNPKFWERLKKSSPKRFDYYRSQFRKAVKKNYANNIQAETAQLIAVKWGELINTTDHQTIPRLITFLKGYPQFDISQIDTSSNVSFPPTMPFSPKPHPVQK